MKDTGIYRCPDDIVNFKLRIRIKEIKSNDYNNKVESTEMEDYEIVNINWQQKIFGRSEIEFYSNLNNCVTDLDKKYHEDVRNLSHHQNDYSVIFTYVDEDKFNIVEENVVLSSEYSSFLENNSSRFNYNLNNEIERNEYFDLEISLKSSVNYPMINMNYEKMYIMADFGEFYENTWIKREFLICTLKYCREMKILYISPDFNKINPHSIQTTGVEIRIFKYYVENVSANLPPELLLKENDIFNKVKLHNLKMKARKLNDFAIGPKQKLNVHLFIEILCGKYFENSNLFVQYFVDLPETWSAVQDTNLQGLTQSCIKNNDKKKTVCFGFPFEIRLQCNIQDLNKNLIPTATPCIYFEVVSKDTWDRFRTEGITYIILPIFRPGLFEFKLNCTRIRPRNLYSNLKRYFIGDYMSYNDIGWFGLPIDDKQDEIINKFGVNTIHTGELTVRANIIHHSQALIKDSKDPDVRLHREKFLLEKLNSSGLIKSVEQVLKAFREARKRMLDARCKT